MHQVIVRFVLFFVVVLTAPLAGCSAEPDRESAGPPLRNESSVEVDAAEAPPGFVGDSLFVASQNEPGVRSHFSCNNALDTVKAVVVTRPRRIDQSVFMFGCNPVARR